jgi:cell division protein FtsI/penicillin-binding protein 2
MSRLTPPLLPGWRTAAEESVQAERARERAEQATLARARHRQAIVFALVAVVVVALFGRAAYWQIGQRGALAGRADAEQARTIKVPTGRGSILDANGRMLAVSVTQDSVIADPDVIRSVNALDAVSAAVAGLIGLPAAAVRSQLDGPGGYVELRDASGRALLLSLDQSDAVSAAIGRGDLPGIALIPVVTRVYPAGALAAQVLGFVSMSDGKGQYGVEQHYESLLAGKPGLLYTAVDANGNPLATAPQRQTPAVPGASLTLTLDANVQYWAEQGLAQTIAQTGADGGSVIVMDPRTGALIAMASVPSFDPNTYAQSSLASFDNPAVSAIYDPGSVMKGVTMAAGIDSGTISPDTVYDDQGVFQVDGVAIHNWDHLGHGNVTMTQVLQYSLNTGAAWVATQIGRNTYDQYLQTFGFGARTGVDLPNESAGRLANPQSAGEAALDLAENAFGESIAVTPLQMVAAYGALANGGVLMRPYVVASATADGGQGSITTYSPQPVRQAVSAATAQTVTQMLVESAYTETQMYLLQGYSVAAKTGTSTPDPSNPLLTYASVIGYAPASDPRFVLLVKLDHPRQTIYGSTAAAPLWRALARQLFTYYQIPPDVPTQSGSQG